MTKISNQYSLTNILTADLANSRLGINNVSPTVALDVTGAGKFSGAVTFGNDLNFSATDSAISFASGAARFFTGGGERMRIDSTGRVLIAGTSSSGSPIFQIQKSDSTTNSSSYFWNTYSSGMMIKNSDATANTLAPIYFYMGSGNNSIAGIAGIQESSTLGAIGFFTGGSGRSSTVPERMRIDSAGNVGIGTSSPKSYGALTINGQTIGLSNIAVDINQAFKFNNYYSSSAGSDKTISTGYAGQVGFTGSIGALTFSTSSSSVAADGNIATSEKMRLTSTGNLGLGTTTPDRDANTRSLAISGGLYAAASLELFGPSAYSGRNYIIFTGTGSSLIFYDLTSSAIRMTISSTGGIGAAGSTTNIYNPSDKRLKQNISTLTYGLDKVKALNPVKFNWADGFEPNEANKTLLGFIAQEVNEVIPEAIESFGGDINLNGKVIDNPLRVNEKFIIPVLVKAIQELSAKVSLLENK